MKALESECPFYKKLEQHLYVGYKHGNSGIVGETCYGCGAER